MLITIFYDLKFLNYFNNLAFKSNKKFIEKEVSNVVNKITQIKKVGATTDASNVIESIDGLISKLNLLKARVSMLY